ncbi:alkaline phosphatase-like protein [Cryphonectria parasitica EP155]|uniref:Alkaline phosphatase-like protein n=1 Tax=Cryphonectria parasitica (strain ATCC 38755 / EP155) TaxID=660469 RepID=A0A9P4Y050_CRYP1|nr:alkaline phosphatase-like protein [Cryphonectria parasitica EP155]KAF3764116.1 alkaline phosphatase-like protein [Cryphonectria parasitica EP155]
MLTSGVVLAVGLLAGLLTRHGAEASDPTPAQPSDPTSNGTDSTNGTARYNIVFIMTDDQDKRLYSTDYQSALQREIVAKGTNFTNHYTTQALCCPARSSLLRGQQIHNTNITNVVKPGGAYNKWVLSEQDQNYLPHWMKKAGYRNECKSRGWDHVDALCEPYIDDYNVPIWSANGDTPVYYPGWHQTDVHRLKVLDRLDNLTSQSDPWFLTITPFTPHVAYEQGNPSSRPIPLQRHMEQFLNATAPQTPNFNPAAEYQDGKSGWVQYLKPMNDSAIGFADFVYQSRLQALQGVDEIIEDVITKLDDAGVLDNTYIIYTSDNGYHLGQHRVPGGKSLFYNEDTNIPFIVRGPDVPEGVVSTLPSLHLDLAPTFLTIAGLPEEDWPPFFDGRSLLDQWQSPEVNNATDAGKGNSRESLNIEYWGLVGIEAPSATQLGGSFYNNTYKTIRIVGDEQNWAYAVWCNGQTELYNISADPYELTNLARGDNISTVHQSVINRLNALLMVTKSCEQDRCRDPWAQLVPDNDTTLYSLVQAMDSTYDTFFDDFEKVQFDTCMEYQWAPNETPFFPALDTLDAGGLGRAYRAETIDIPDSPGLRVIQTPNYYGTAEQRNATFTELEASARYMTAQEIAETIA